MQVTLIFTRVSSIILILVLLAFSVPLAFAQSTPTEFAEMSLEELFELKIENETNDDFLESHWHFNYKYMAAQFDGYLAGDSDLSLDQVFWSGPSEERTSTNFPLVPTVIKQQAHLFHFGYQYSDKIELFLSLPYIQQRTDHISRVANYEFFMVETDGIGDAVLSLNYKFKDLALHRWWVNFSLSLPTGSIDEVGDTPRGEGNQPLPYTMQLGSGTFDFPIEFNYQYLGKHDVGLSMSAIIRSGKNDRDYRLGNTYRISANYRFKLTQNVRLLLGTDAYYWTSISGEDRRLAVAGDFPYAASIINPNFYGGKKLKLSTGFSYRYSKNYTFTTKLSKPVYQYLNGPQPKEMWQASIQLNSAF
ncbi:transporter [Agaribacter marinus]|uniref:Porin n=1 Tax=Agaribacter marinus TaxID=1431249 RepID=A0AA37T2A8_9ALTE|nr:transporter [Agaribacter marinus]GLR72645.1 hypothetical protein GCM10007852_35530 [Agaribacter marinus]